MHLHSLQAQTVISSGSCLGAHILLCAVREMNFFNLLLHQAIKTPGKPMGQMTSHLLAICLQPAADTRWVLTCRSIDILGWLQNLLRGPDALPVQPGNIRFAMAATGGRNTSVKYKCIWDWLDEQGIVSG